MKRMISEQSVALNKATTNQSIWEVIQIDAVHQLSLFTLDDFLELNNQGMHVIHYAAAHNSVQCLGYFINSGIEISLPHSTTNSAPLHFAAEYGHVEVVKILLEKGANIGAQNQNGYTPLHFAAEYGHVEVVKILLEKGANIEAQNQNAYTTLHFAAEKGNFAVIKILLEKVADIEAKSQNGYTPLHLAAGDGNVEVVKILLEKGANIEAQNLYAYTPLHFAAEYGHVEVVKILLDKGADIKAKDQHDYTPLHLAAGDGHVEIIKMLLLAGADIDNVLLGRHNIPDPEISCILQLKEALKDICLLQFTQQKLDSSLFKTKSEQFETYTKKYITEFLIKNGIKDGFLDHLKANINCFPDRLASVVNSAVDKLISESNDHLEIIEGVLRQKIEGIYNLPFSVFNKQVLSKLTEQQLTGLTAKTLTEEQQQQKEVIDFYQRNPEYKIAGNYLLHLINNKSASIDISALNHLMLQDKNLADLVKDLNKYAQTVDLKNKLNAVIVDHQCNLTNSSFTALVQVEINNEKQNNIIQNLTKENKVIKDQLETQKICISKMLEFLGDKFPDFDLTLDGLVPANENHDEINVMGEASDF
jgi:ankyrin repeat protein